MKISIFQFFCILALVAVKVDCTPITRGRARNVHRGMTEDEEGQLIELSNLANQTERLENLLEESKAPRPPSPSD